MWKLLTTRSASLAARLAGVLAVVLRTSLAGAEVSSEDWPRFLGSQANNISTEHGLVDKWPPGGPRLVWQKEVGSGYGAPSVLGPRLALHHRLGTEEIIECFDAANGDTVWRYSYPSKFADPFGYNNGPRCTPLLTPQYCFAFGAEGRLVCLDIKTGERVWERQTSKDWKVPEPFFGVGSTPWLEDDKLIVMVGGQPNSTVVALDAATGKTVWENAGRSNWQGARTIGWRSEAPYQWSGDEKLASYSSPVGATIHGRRHILCLTRQGLVSLNPTNGAVNFSRWFQSPVDQSVNAMCPVVSEDLVLISSAYYRLGSVLLQVAPDGNSFQEVWRSPVRHSTGASPEPPVLEIHWNTPVLHRGYLYAFSGRNENEASFRCVELKTGKLMWNRDESWRRYGASQPPVYGRGSAILADDKLIVLGEGGRLGLFALNPEQPEEICVSQVPQLKFPCWTGPVLSHKRLYLRSEDRLICLDLRNDK